METLERRRRGSGTDGVGGRVTAAQAHRAASQRKDKGCAPARRTTPAARPRRPVGTREGAARPTGGWEVKIGRDGEAREAATSHRRSRAAACRERVAVASGPRPPGGSRGPGWREGMGAGARGNPAPCTSAAGPPRCPPRPEARSQQRSDASTWS